MKIETIEKLNEWLIICPDYKVWLADQPDLWTAYRQTLGDSEAFLQIFRLFSEKIQRQVTYMIVCALPASYDTVGEDYDELIKTRLWGSYCKSKSIDKAEICKTIFKWFSKDELTQELLKLGFTLEEIG